MFVERALSLPRVLVLSLALVNVAVKASSPAVVAEPNVEFNRQQQHQPQPGDDKLKSSTSSNDVDTPVETKPVDHGRELMEWMKREEGAFFHPNLVIRRTGPNETSPYFGMFATGKIRTDELMIEIPRSMVFHPDPPQVGDRVTAYYDDDEEYSGEIKAVQADGTFDIVFDNVRHVERGVDPDIVAHEDYPSCCATVHKLVREMRLAGKSRYAPYVNYLLTQPAGQLPTSWSKAGQALLLAALGLDADGDQLLPPFGLFGWIEEDWHARCRGGSDPLSESAYMLLAQRGWDEVMIPVFDMMSHRNGHFLNTDHDPIRDGEAVKVRAARDIEAGEEIYTSYNFCTDCQARTHNYGTAELLRDYGFVEDYPQRWVLDRIRFDLDYVRNEKGAAIGDLEVKWYGPQPSAQGIGFLREQVKRLEEYAEMYLVTRDLAVPDHEWNVVSQFVRAMITAFRLAVQSVSPSSADDDGECSLDGTCGVSSDRYSRLEEEEEIWGDERPFTCDTKTIYAFDEWETLETIQSPYQQLAFSTIPALEDDMCFDLDDIVQICASYRPHYHEMMVHFPARFIETVKRVLFVGGGDSMLLHEALKYPSLELVVGLELDQIVTRNNFKYFGTQPHWDDPRVEWWFGDATKSLVMLPKEYFGSFDLVLVDLSETVQALSVTEELDVLHALALLVKPDGILVQNEFMHFLEQASVFRNTLHVHYYGVPIVCSQSLILASNGIEFLLHSVHNHKVNPLYKLLDEENLQFNIIRDFQRNYTNPSHCSAASYSDALVETQVRSPGILMIVEVEGATDLSNGESVKKSLSDALQLLGLNLISSLVTALSEGRSLMTLLLKEGYVVAHTWSDLKYCAFDIHLWSRFDQQQAVKSALVNAAKSSIGTAPLVSSYRIVAGGVFGCDNWKTDEKVRGPQLSSLCSQPSITDKQPAIRELGPRELNVVLRESMKLIGDNSYVMAVLCGKDKDQCASYSELQGTTDAKSIILIRACDGLDDDLTFVKDGPERMLGCEKEIMKVLQDSSIENGIRAVVLDSTAPFALAQIVHRIFSNSFNVRRWLAKDLLVEAPVLDGVPWRRTFVDFFRKETHPAEPVFSAEVAFTGLNQELRFVVMSSGDEQFSSHLLTFTESVQNETGLVPEIQKIRAGEFTYQHDFETDQVFSHRDYNRVSALKQWREQHPLGLQTVFQMEAKSALTMTKESLEQAVKRALSAVAPDIPLNDDRFQAESVGEGCVISVHWEGGNLVTLWDGRLHVDLNLFTYHGGVTFADEFEAAFLRRAAQLHRTLRDEQPRGTGGVILSAKPNDDPTWHT